MTASSPTRSGALSAKTLGALAVVGVVIAFSLSSTLVKLGPAGMAAGDTPIILQTVDGTVRSRPGHAPAPDAVLTGPSQLAVGVLIGRVNLDDAKAQGLHYDGDPAILQRVQPAEVAAV